MSEKIKTVILIGAGISLILVAVFFAIIRYEVFFIGGIFSYFALLGGVGFSVAALIFAAIIRKSLKTWHWIALILPMIFYVLILTIGTNFVHGVYLLGELAVRRGGFGKFIQEYSSSKTKPEFIYDSRADDLNLECIAVLQQKDSQIIFFVKELSVLGPAGFAYISDDNQATLESRFGEVSPENKLGMVGIFI